MTRLKHWWKKHKNLMLEPEQEMADIKVDEGIQELLEPKTEIPSHERVETIDEDRELEPSTTHCPECGTRLIEPAIPIINPQGVGQAYSQHMRSWTVPTDIVCPKCGLVIGQSKREVHS
ncbi:MAG: hypothetical protein QXH91_01480 [Candidatus Bathyarchaeia archaeon]